MHYIPEEVETTTIENYDEFLQKRRHLMAQKIKKYYATLQILFKDEAEEIDLSSVDSYPS